MQINYNLTFQHFLIGIFAVANNFPAIGPFLQICRGLSPRQQLRLCKIATFTSFIVMMMALIIGQGILEFFGISIEAFRIAGGVLLGVSGMNMLNSPPLDTNDKINHHPDSYSKIIPQVIIPVAIPLTTGAGTISTIIIFADEIGRDWYALAMLILAILVSTVMIYVIFRYSTRLLDLLGKLGMNVLIKVVGLFTLALGVQFILQGVASAFPALGMK